MQLSCSLMRSLPCLCLVQAGGEASDSDMGTLAKVTDLKAVLREKIPNDSCSLTIAQAMVCGAVACSWRHVRMPSTRSEIPPDLSDFLLRYTAYIGSACGSASSCSNFQNRPRSVRPPTVSG